MKVNRQSAERAEARERERTDLRDEVHDRGQHLHHIVIRPIV
jgi:hypothetical protein